MKHIAIARLAYEAQRAAHNASCKKGEERPDYEALPREAWGDCEKAVIQYHKHGTPQKPVNAEYGCDGPVFARVSELLHHVL